MRQGITFQEVSEAAESLQVQGENPTIDRIREFLGGTGSNTTISKYLNVWRHGAGVTAASNSKSPPPDLVQAAVERVWQQIREEADAEVEKVKNEATLLVQEAEENAIKSEEECRRVMNDYSNLEQSYNRVSAEKEILALDLKAIREEHLLLVERYKALEGRYTDIQGLTSQHLKDLSEAHKNELNRLDEKYRLQEQSYNKLIDEIKTQNESERQKQMVLVDSLNTEIKKAEKRIQDLEKENSDKNIHIAKLTATNKLIEAERNSAIKRLEDQDNAWNNRWNILSNTSSLISNDLISKINEFPAINTVMEKVNTDLINVLDTKFFEIKDYIQPVVSLVTMEKKDE
jgi:chromosome segregation ATPase